MEFYKSNPRQCTERGSTMMVHMDILLSVLSYRPQRENCNLLQESNASFSYVGPSQSNETCVVPIS